MNVKICFVYLHFSSIIHVVGPNNFSADAYFETYHRSSYSKECLLLNSAVVINDFNTTWSISISSVVCAGNAWHQVETIHSTSKELDAKLH